MNLVQRYIFRKLLGSFLIAFPAMALTIWSTQALRFLGLITDRGQGIGTFVEATLLLLPSMILIIGPVTMLVVVIVTLNGLNNESELVALNAAGASRRLILAPVLALAIPVTVAAALCSLYFQPVTAQRTSALIADVNANVLTQLLQPGRFRMLEDDVAIQVAAIRPGGRLEGIFVHDRRLPAQNVTYMARSGAIVDGPDGRFLMMQDGLVQRKPTDSDAVSVIQFASYFFDLSTLANRVGGGSRRPNEQSTAYILNPDPSDPVFQATPFLYTAELHNRLTVPLYVLSLALIPAAFLGRARSIRQGRIMTTLKACLLGGLSLGCSLYFGGALANNAALLPLVYGVPLAGILLPFLAIATARRPRLPPFLRRSGASASGRSTA